MPADKKLERPKAPFKPKVSLTAPKAKVVTVKRGDTLSSIAKRQGTSVAALKKLNPRLTTVAKYQGGNRIFSGTRVRTK